MTGKTPTQTHPLLSDDELGDMPSPDDVDPVDAAIAQVSEPAEDPKPEPPADEPPKEEEEPTDTPPADPPVDPPVETPPKVDAEPEPKETPEPAPEVSALPSATGTEQQPTPTLPYEDEPIQQTYIPPPPKDYEGQRNSLMDNLGALAEKYEDPTSEITLAQFTREQAELNSKIQRLDSQHDAFQQASAQAEANETAAWNRSMDRFISHVKQADGTDYSDDAQFAQLCSAANFVETNRASTGKPFASRGELMIAAHNVLRVQRGEAPLGTTPTPKTPAPAASDAPPAPAKPAEREAPPAPRTLAALPNAEGAVEQSNADPFAHIDALQDDDGTEAFARMSTAQQDAYLGKS